MNKIPAISISMILLISIMLPVVSACDAPMGSTSGEFTALSTFDPEDAITLEKTIKDGEDWVDTYHTIPCDMIRFRIKLTYDADWDGGPSYPGETNGYMINKTTIIDNLPPELDYKGNANHEPLDVSSDNKTITWYFPETLLDDDTIVIEFDAMVMAIGTFVNNAEVHTTESCYGEPRDDTAQATIISECTGPDCHDTKYMDVDDDGKLEQAIDQNDDSSDGYEVYKDPDSSSDDVLNIDGDDDGKIDHFIDVFDKGEDVDKYWDPDDEFVSDVVVIDVDYDGTDEWVYDSGDEAYDVYYYDPDDEEIKPFVPYRLTVNPQGPGSVTIEPTGDFSPYYLDGFEVELTAVPDAGATFDNYSGDASSISENIFVIMNRDKTINASFSDGNNDDDDLSVEITKPKENYLYFFGIGIKNPEDKTQIIGPINVKAKVEGDNEIDRVEFYLDGDLKRTDSIGPLYNWFWLLRPKGDNDEFTIKVIAYDSEGHSSTDYINVTRSAFTPIRNHPWATIIIGGGGLVAYLLKNKGGSEPDDTVPVEPDTQPDSNWEPVVDAGGPYEGFAGEPVQFDGSDTYDPNYDDLTFSWDFGDGSKGSGKTPKHTYDEPGTYTIKLTVTDEDGASDEDTTTVVIEEGTGAKGGDEGDLFWYIVTALGTTMTAAIGLLYFRRFLYV